MRDTPPPCVSVCPLGVDVRGLVSKARGGRWNPAYRAYRERVLFPRIVSAYCETPCSGACVKGRLSGRSVDLKAIERDVVYGASPLGESRYAIPRKEERIAITGVGLSALACAWKLASGGYQVHVYCQEDTRKTDAVDLEAEALFADDVRELFAHVDCTWETCTESPDTGFLQEQYHVVVHAKKNEDELRSAVASKIARGLEAATAIEERLRIGALSGEGKAATAHSGNGCLTLALDALTAETRSVDERFYDLKYDLGETPGKSEAERCLLCNCSACIDACPMIRWFRQNPKRIATDLGVSVLPVEGKIQRVGSRMMNSCNLCGLCTAVCPASVDTNQAMESSRRILKESGHMAPAYHDFWMDDLAFSMSDEAYGIVSEGNAASLLFFPGCQLAASLPDTVARVFEYIQNTTQGVAMLLSCCGVPADWAAEKEVFAEVTAKIKGDWERLGNPEVLFACSACKNTFAKVLPEASGRLVYEWLADNGVGVSSDKQNAQGLRAAVFDPCNSRGDPAGQSAVRRLAEALGYSIEALPFSGEEAACCGFGGHIYPANPGLLEAILDERASVNPELPRLTYCANCRDLFRYKGMDSTHILEILFPQDGASGETGLPSLSERRGNRRDLKARYAAGFLPARYRETMAIRIPREIERKMTRLLLLREDVEKTVAYCEENNTKIIDVQSGRSLGHFRNRLVTVWVEYEITDDDIVVWNVYTHRMKIGEVEAVLEDK